MPLCKMNSIVYAHPFINKKRQGPINLVVTRIPAAGVEPARPRGHWILSPARLPIPPRRHIRKAVTGFEPVMKVLQTSALPLGYTATKI